MMSQIQGDLPRNIDIYLDLQQVNINTDLCITNKQNSNAQELNNNNLNRQTLGSHCSHFLHSLLSKLPKISYHLYEPFFIIVLFKLSA